MTEFFSDEAIERHKDYIRTQRLRYSILEKSINGIKDKEYEDILRQKMRANDKRDVITLLSLIKIHDCFFSSFSSVSGMRSELVKSQFGSEAGFLNALYKACMNIPVGFVSVSVKKGKIGIKADADNLSHFLEAKPLLAIDVWEHAYFLDYGFDKEKYLRNTLPYLNLDKITD